MSSRSSAWNAGLLAISAGGLAFSLAAHLTSTHVEPGSTLELADLLFGESRQVLSLNFFNEADLYFHKGVGHREASAPIPGPFQRWQADIVPEQHAHAEGESSAEILPWLKLATRADPHNVEAFLVAAFWASTGLNRPNLASEILDEAQRLNPTDYRIAIEKGRLAVAAGEFGKAIPLFDVALALHSHTPATPDRTRELALDQGVILTFLGYLHEIKGEVPEAIQSYKSVPALFPERASMQERIALLEAGKKPADSAQSLLERISRRTVHDTCKDDDHHEHEQ